MAISCPSWIFSLLFVPIFNTLEETPVRAALTELDYDWRKFCGYRGLRKEDNPHYDGLRELLRQREVVKQVLLFAAQVWIRLWMTN